MDEHDRNVKLTYLGLRLGMILLVVMLFVAVGQVVIAEGHWLESISAYYYTPARAVFIGSLSAIGAALIVYRGNTDTENVLLDFAGFLAFVVAFVPTDIEETCSYCTGLSSDEVTAAIANNLLAVALTGLAAIALGFLVRTRSHTGERTSPTRPAKISAVVSFLALAAGFLFFVFNRDKVEEYGHDVAATFFFVFILLVVGVNAWSFSRQTRPTPGAIGTAAKNRYGLVALIMVATLVVLYLTKGVFDQWLFALEALLIAEFAVYWGLQTAELGGQVSREDTDTTG